MKAALDKKRLMKEIEADRRKTVAGKLRELRALVKAARQVRRERLAGIRLQCRAARIKLRTVCGVRAERAKREGAEAIAARQKEVRDEEQLERLQRDADTRHRKGVVRAGVSSRARARERVQESDDEVRMNIPASMVEVFNKVRRHIKGSDRKSRTEAFLQWAEENPGEVYAVQEAEARKEIRKMVSEHNRIARRHQMTELDDVPF